MSRLSVLRCYADGAFGALGAFGAVGALGAHGALGVATKSLALAPQLEHAAAEAGFFVPHFGHSTSPPIEALEGLKHIGRFLSKGRRLPKRPSGRSEKRLDQEARFRRRRTLREAGRGMPKREGRRNS